MGIQSVHEYCNVFPYIANATTHLEFKD